MSETHTEHSTKNGDTVEVFEDHISRWVDITVNRVVTLSLSPDDAKALGARLIEAAGSLSARMVGAGGGEDDQ